MKKALLAASVAAVLRTARTAMAQTPAPAPAAKAEPDYTLTANVGLFSDYRFRGFTQTDYQPAIQGGFDFAHKSGFYLGNWNSNVSSALYNGAPIEMDFYGGYKHAFGDFGLDVGAHLLLLPGHRRVQPGLRGRRTSRPTSAARGVRCRSSISTRSPTSSD